MTSPSGLHQSLQTKLLRFAKERRFDPNLILTRFAAERFLYRISISRYADRFVLKGAMLLVAWLGDMVRPTRDIDLLGFGDLSDAALARTIHESSTAEGDSRADPSLRSVRLLDVVHGYAFVGEPSRALSPHGSRPPRDEPS